MFNVWRRFIAALDKKCAATELEIEEGVLDCDVIKRGKQSITDIGARINEMKEQVKGTAGIPTVVRAKRFGQELVVAERGPQKLDAFLAQLPDRRPVHTSASHPIHYTPVPWC